VTVPPQSQGRLPSIERKRTRESIKDAGSPMRRRGSKISVVSEAPEEETPSGNPLTFTDKRTGFEITEEYNLDFGMGKRPQLTSRGPAAFIKRSVCGKTDEVFTACVGRHNDLKKLKAPELNKSFWGRMQGQKPELDLDSVQIKE